MVWLGRSELGERRSIKILHSSVPAKLLLWGNPIFSNTIKGSTKMKIHKCMFFARGDTLCNDATELSIVEFIKWNNDSNEESLVLYGLTGSKWRGRKEIDQVLTHFSSGKTTSLGKSYFLQHNEKINRNESSYMYFFARGDTVCNDITELGVVEFQNILLVTFVVPTLKLPESRKSLNPQEVLEQANTER